MEICTIKFITNKWHCIGPDGKTYCAFANKKWAEECAKVHGWNF